MPLTAPLSSIKQKLLITNTNYDSLIALVTAEATAWFDSLLGSALIDSVYLGAINLSLVEWIAGEVAATLAREPGALDEVWNGSIRVKPVYHSVLDPFGLKAQAMQRLDSILASAAERRPVLAAPKAESE